MNKQKMKPGEQRKISETDEKFFIGCRFENALRIFRFNQASSFQKGRLKNLRLFLHCLFLISLIQRKFFCFNTKNHNFS